MSEPIKEIWNTEQNRELWRGAVQLARVAQALSGRPAISFAPVANLLDSAQAASVEKYMRERFSGRHAEYADKDLDNDVRIGVTWLRVPPSGIRVYEARFNEEIHGLRTAGGSLVKSGRGQIRIDLALEFPDANSIGTQLREIIAQFRATPFLPIESKYIFNAILGAAGVASDKDIDKLDAERSTIHAAYNSVRERMLDVVKHCKPLQFILLDWIQGWRGGPVELIDLLEYLYGLPLEALSGSVSKGIAWHKDSRANNRYGKFNAPPSLIFKDNDIKKLQQAEKELLELVQESRQVISKLAEIEQAIGIRVGYMGRPVVTVALHNLDIRTVPGEQHSVRANLSCIYFVHDVYVPDFLYMTFEGGASPEIDDCPFFWDYVNNRFLADRGTCKVQQHGGYYALAKYDHNDRGAIQFEFPTSKLEKVTDDTAYNIASNPRIDAKDAWGTALSNMAGKDISGTMFQSRRETLTIGPENKNSILQQVIIQLQNRLAIQPIQGGLYGTVQHLGSLNARVSMQFAAVGTDNWGHDVAIGNLQRMKHEVEQASLLLGPKGRRNSHIGIVNSLLNLAGVYSVQLDSLSTETVPGEINSSVLRMDMTEFTVGQEHRESLESRVQTTGGKLQETVFKFACEMVEESISGFGRSPAGALGIDSGLSNYVYLQLYGGRRIFESWHRPIEDMTPIHTFVTDSEDKPIISVRVTATVIRDLFGPQILEKLRTNNPALSDMIKDQESAQHSLRNKLDDRVTGRSADDFSTGFSAAFAANALSIYRELRQPGYIDKQSLSASLIDAECERIAKECIAFWKMTRVSLEQAKQIPYFDQYVKSGYSNEKMGRGKELYNRRFTDSKEASKRDTSDIIDIPSTPVSDERWASAFWARLRSRQYSQEAAQLSVLSRYLQTKIKPLNDYANSMTREVGTLPNYPDLDLPTYAQAFMPPEAVQPAVVSGIEGKTTIERLYKNSMNFGGFGPRTKQMLSRFFPTFRDLGVRAPIRNSQDDIARSWEDYVDPDFWYYHTRRADFYQSMQTIVEDGMEDLSPRVAPAAKYIYDKDGGFPGKTRADTAAAERWYRSRSSMGMVDNTLTQPDRDRGVSANLDLRARAPGYGSQFYMRAGRIMKTEMPGGYGEGETFNYRPGLEATQNAVGEFAHDRPAHLRMLFREMWSTQKDDLHRMLRAYPTFKLMFIEQDDERFQSWDDFYGYNSVASIRISEHKFEPSLLELKIINTTGNLDANRGSMQDPDKRFEEERYGRHGNVDPRTPVQSTAVEWDTGEPIKINRFNLQVGTMLELRLGYGSGEDDLVTKFVGQIVEITPGDVITIIAQSYKNQLTVPLNTYRDGKDADPFHVVEYVMTASPADAFGRWNPYELGLLAGVGRDGQQYNHSSTERRGFDGRRGTEGEEVLDNYYVMGGEGGAFSWIGWYKNPLAMAAGVLSPGDTATMARLLNMWATRRTWNVFLPRSSHLREMYCTKREFLIADRSGLEVLHELTRHLPGYVFDARPYGHQMTLFFGKPEQFYFYTDTKQDEEVLWREMKAERTTDTAKAFIEVFKRFIKSYQYNEFINRWGDLDRSILFRNWVAIRKKYDQTTVRGIDLSLGASGRWEALFDPWDNAEFRESSPQDVVPQLDNIEAIFDTPFLKLLTAAFWNMFGQLDVWVSRADLSDPVEALADRQNNNALHRDMNNESKERLRQKLESMRSNANVMVEYWDALMAAGILLEDSNGKQMVSDQEASEALAKIEGLIKRGGSGLHDRRPDVTLDNMPGNILVSLPFWRNAVDVMSGPISSRTNENSGIGGDVARGTTWEDIRRQTFQLDDPNYHIFSPKREKAAPVTNIRDETIDRYAYERMVQSVIVWNQEWKRYLILFKDWAQEQMQRQAPDVVRAIGTSRMVSALGLNPRTKRFRNYHLANYRQHIISNGIIATKDQMANTVILKYPEDIDYSKGPSGRVVMDSSVEWNTIEIMADEGIDPREKKVRIVTETNIEDYDRALVAGWANLAEALRPMYRGELVLRGNPDIHPFDIIYIVDPYESMYGFVEVERVITNFDSEVGYTTTVIPHMVTLPQCNSSRADMFAAGVSLGFSSLGGVLKATAAAGASGAAVGMLGGAAAGAGVASAITAPMGGLIGGLTGAWMGYSVSKGLVDASLQQAAGAGLWGVLAGRGKFGRHSVPVDIIPLIRNGRPWTAGLRGWGIGGWRYRINRMWLNIVRGAKIASPVLHKTLGDLGGGG